MADEPRERENAPDEPTGQNVPDLADVPEPEQAVSSMEQAMQSLEAETGDAEADSANPTPFTAPPLEQIGAAAANSAHGEGMELLDDVSLRVQIELGRTLMYVEDVLRLNADSVIELDKAAGDPVDIFVNNRKVARGEVLVVNDNFCVRVSEIIGDGRGGSDGGESPSGQSEEGQAG